ncbi:MAG: phosphoribosyltransferase family protein [Candidatus Nealsonbacteria bacterium]
MKEILKTLLDIFFPMACINCKREENSLCQDCLAIIDVLDFQCCPFCDFRNITPDGKTCKKHEKEKILSGLYAATSLQDHLVKKSIDKFKNKPFLKSLAKPLASLIISHFELLGKQFKDFLLIPVPLEKSKLRKRGFNQAEELTKEISEKLNIPFTNNVLLKNKEKFLIKNEDKIKDKNILLVDDFFITGTTMEECATILKKSGAKEMFGAVIARGISN